MPRETPLQNLFSAVPDQLEDELVEVLARGERVRIERIVSTGQASPEGFWYDSAQAEWVVVLTGEAGLLFDGDEAPHHLHAGDHLLIPARRRHRVDWTSPDEPTVWLAVFFDHSA